MLQFTFAIILIISTIVVRNQVIYAQNRDKGYSNNNLIRVDFAGDINKNYSLIKQDLINTGVSISVTKTLKGIEQGGWGTWGFRWQGQVPKDTNTAITFLVLMQTL